MEKLEAGILGTVFRNEENGWTVLTVRLKDGDRGGHPA